MKNMQLSKLKQRKTNYFKKIGNVTFESRKLSDYLAKRTFEALPKRLKEFVKEEKQQLIKNISHLIGVSGDEGINIYEAMTTYATKRYERTYTNRKQEIWDSFKTMESSVYYKYNSYIYRLGYSASKYWFENVEFTNIEGSLVTARLKLPSKASGVVYDTLEIIHDFSDFYTEAMMY